MMKKRQGVPPITENPPKMPLKTRTGGALGNPNSVGQVHPDVIGEGLRRIFDEVVEEPIPPEFLQLLNQIDRKNDQ